MKRLYLTICSDVNVRGLTIFRKLVLSLITVITIHGKNPKDVLYISGISAQTPILCLGHIGRRLVKRRSLMHAVI